MMFIGRYRVAPGYPYAEFDEKGNYNRDDKGNRRWNSLIEMLTVLVADASRPADERERAAEVLTFYSETVSGVADYLRPQGTPQSIIDSDINVAKMLGQNYVSMMWYTPEDCLFRDWPQTEDHSIHPSRSVLSRTYHDPTFQRETLPPTPVASLPQGVPISNFTPAIPLPVLPPTYEEQAAVALVHSQFIPDKVAARIAAIDSVKKPLSTVAEIEASMAAREDLQRRLEENSRELARLRALRGQTE